MNVLWSTILFKFNQDRIDDIIKIAEAHNVDKFILVRSSLFGSKNSWWIDETLGYDPLEPDSKWVSVYEKPERYNKKLSTTVPPQSKYFDNVKELSNVIDDKYSIVTPLCMNGDRGKYIDAEGIMYPCSWVSHPFGHRKNEHKQIEWKDSMWVEHKDKFNMNLRSMEDIINDDIWKSLMQSWDDEKSCFIECSQKCPKSQNSFGQRNAKSL